MAFVETKQARPASSLHTELGLAKEPRIVCPCGHNHTVDHDRVQSSLPSSPTFMGESDGRHLKYAPLIGCLSHHPQRPEHPHKAI